MNYCFMYGLLNITRPYPLLCTFKLRYSRSQFSSVLQTWVNLSEWSFSCRVRNIALYSADHFSWHNCYTLKNVMLISNFTHLYIFVNIFIYVFNTFLFSLRCIKHSSNSFLFFDIFFLFLQFQLPATLVLKYGLKIVFLSSTHSGCVEWSRYDTGFGEYNQGTMLSIQGDQQFESRQSVLIKTQCRLQFGMG